MLICLFAENNNTDYAAMLILPRYFYAAASCRAARRAMNGRLSLRVDVYARCRHYCRFDTR